MKKPNLLSDYRITHVVLADGSVYVDFAPCARGLVADRPLNVPAAASCELVVVPMKHGHRCVWQCEPPAQLDPAQFEATAISRARKLRSTMRPRLVA